MKKTNILAIITTCLLIANSVSAQKGSWYLGGQGGYTSITEKNSGVDDIKTTEWNVSPEIGLWTGPTWQLGLGVNLSGSEVDDVTTITTNRWAPVLYMRKHFAATDNFGVFAGIVANFTTGTVKHDAGTDDLSGWGANLSLGAKYSITPRWTIIAQYGLFGYTSETIKSDSNENTVDNLGFNVNTLGPVFNVGIYWTFFTNE